VPAQSARVHGDAGRKQTEQLEQNLGALDVLPKIDEAIQQRIEKAVA
jgi:aryl-alcohol dehydrogenase-like predicted oxidoreductase